MATKRITLPIDNLGCGGGGALTVERALERQPGVVRVYVNPATEMAYIEFDPAVAEPRHFIDAVTRVGFRAGQPSTR
jgi:copper chaperone CopZ